LLTACWQPKWLKNFKEGGIQINNSKPLKLKSSKLEMLNEHS